MDDLDLKRRPVKAETPPQTDFDLAGPADWNISLPLPTQANHTE